MIILTNTGTADKLRCVTSAAVTVDVHASYVDNNAGTMTPGRQNTAISTATTTDICAGPSSGQYRNVVTLNVRNRDSSASVDVTITYDVGGTVTELFKGTLRAQDTLEYIEGVGFFVVTTATARLRTFRLASDYTNATTTTTAVSGLTNATGVGTFIFEYFIVHRTDTTTTGHKESVNHTGTVSAFNYWDEITSAITTTNDGAQDQDIVLTTGGSIQVNAARAKGTAGLGAWVSADTINVDLLTIIRGIMTVTVDGNIELWWGSEAATTTTVKAGSSLRLTKTD